MREKPYTVNELFEAICKQIELPDILDYSLSHEYSKVVKDYEWDFGNHLDFGGNEGIYLDMCMVKGSERRYLGTFKTLDESEEAMHTMANLLADFIIAGRRFIEENIDDFEWEGYKVKAEGLRYSICCLNIEEAKSIGNKFKDKGYSNVTILDMANRKEVDV